MTMPELAITLAIAGLLALTAAPMIRTTLRRYALEEASQRFTADLVRAQTLAIKLNRAVTVQRVGLTGYRVDGGPTRPLPTSVSFATSAPDSVRFVSFGPPTTGATAFTLQWETKTQTVTVNTAGRITR